jgi:NADH-quinone oxidoreductase subunit N
MVFGGVNAVFEQNLKRFIAYSSINQIGFLIIGLLGFESSIFSLQIYIYFLFVYILNIGIFLFFIF